MDSVQDTPAKRRKTETGHINESQAYNSQDDSGDDLFRGYETVATIPLRRKSSTPSSPAIVRSSPPSHITQPTQLINRYTQRLDPTSPQPPIVQVAASSPLVTRVTPSPSPATAKQPGGLLAKALAPAGTMYRPPMGAPKPPAIVDLSDDEGPTYRGEPSDEESQRTHMADIKPSTFIQKAQRSLGGEKNRTQDSTNDGSKRFREITSNSFYKPLEKQGSKVPGSTLSGSVYDSRNRDDKVTSSRINAPAKRSADVMANSYGNPGRIARQDRQTGPAKARPVREISIDDIEDFQLKKKVMRMREILPKYSVVTCRNALLSKKANFEDAMDLLISQETQPPEVDLTLSDSDQPLTKTPIQEKPSAKQKLKAPNKSIQEKWTATQSFPRNVPSPTPIIVNPPEKKKRRLVQGRRKVSSPVVERPVPASSPLQRDRTPDSDDDSDSAIELESEEDTELKGKVLNFLNTCSILDLADTAAVTEDVATVLLSQRPFQDLDEVRQVSTDVPGAKQKKTTKRSCGDKVVEKCLSMWAGYEAVDELVRRCEDLGKPVAEEMKKWGVDVFGASKGGELELVTFDQFSNDGVPTSTRDSGIGTPSSVIWSGDEGGDGDRKKGSGLRTTQNNSIFYPQPPSMGEGIILKDYQIVGINWLSLLYEKQLSCILADDMGLGKTCQVIAFLAHLLEKNIKGPHLVVVPGSTLENWLREFSIFCPKLSVMPYYANQKDRFSVREQIKDNLDTINVVVTTYGMAKIPEDNKFLRRLKFVACVYDEGHILKNRQSAGYDQLMRIPARFRLLLTGTPLQNNLGELASLLAFILPSVFKEHSGALECIFDAKAKTTDETHAALLSAQRIARARSMMTPFVLRRKKYQVLKDLPSKTRRVEYCELTQSQTDIYEEIRNKAHQIVQDRAAGKKTGKATTNILMALRQASIHPLLFRRIYNDKTIKEMSRLCLQEEGFENKEASFICEDMGEMTDFELHSHCELYPTTMAPFLLQNNEWMDSGKVSKLCGLLNTFKANGDRVLVFSQFVMVMNILEYVLETLGMRFFRLDGQTKMDERQDMIDQFYAEEDITVFLLSTKAGGAGINLACANKVIIFDSSFNPQDDIQAENRAHRVGQTREVEVVRLVTRGTIEEQIHALGETKLTLDQRVAGDGEIVAEEDEKKAQNRGIKAVEEAMLKQMNGEEGKTNSEGKMEI